MLKRVSKSRIIWSEGLFFMYFRCGLLFSLNLSCSTCVCCFVSRNLFRKLIYFALVCSVFRAVERAQCWKASWGETFFPEGLVWSPGDLSFCSWSMSHQKINEKQLEKKMVNFRTGVRIVLKCYSVFVYF